MKNDQTPPPIDEATRRLLTDLIEIYKHATPAQRELIEIALFFAGIGMLARLTVTATLNQTAPLTIITEQILSKPEEPKQ